MKLAFSLLALSACLALVAAGCGGTDSATSDSGIPTASAEEAKEREPPNVKVPPIPPPDELVVEDLIEGTGEEAKKGDRVEVNYVAYTWNNNLYADSWKYSETPVFRLGFGPVLGAAELSPGFDKGIRGMKEGGRREVIVPISELRYPVEEGRLPLKPSDTWIAVVDLLKVD